MKADNQMPLACLCKQAGAALILSLIFLMILTLIGVSGLNNSGLELRMAHNYRLNNYIFHGAESEIQAIVQTATEQGNPLYTVGDNILKMALDRGQGVVLDNELNADAIDYPAYALPNVGAAALTTSSTVENRGQSLCPGSSSGTVNCELFQITSAASIGGTGAAGTHRQGIRMYIPAPN